MREVVALVVVVFATSGDAAAKCRTLKPGEWTTVSSAGFGSKPGELDGPVALWVGKRLFVWDGASRLTTAKFYDPCTDKWSSAGLPKAAAKIEIGPVPDILVHGKKLVIAGSDAAGRTNLWIYDGAWRSYVKSDLASSWVFAVGNYLVVSGALIFDLSKRTFRRVAETDYPENAGNSYTCQTTVGDTWLIWDNGRLLRNALGKNVWAKLAGFANPGPIRCTIVQTGATFATLLYEDMGRKIVGFGSFDPATETFTKLAEPPEGATTLTRIGGVLVAYGSDKNGPIGASYDAAKKQWTKLVVPTLGSKCTPQFTAAQTGALLLAIDSDLKPAQSTLGPDSTCIGTGDGSSPTSWPAARGSFKAAWLTDVSAGFTAAIDLGTWQEVTIAQELEAMSGEAWRKNAGEWQRYDSKRKAWTTAFVAAPAVTGLRSYSHDYVFYWGVPVTKMGDGCNNPYAPRTGGGTCDPPAGKIEFARFKPGGWILER
ncbi:MAG TPA: hypothetical protein VIV40_18490 [Kofleriaceae bacterium]